MARNLQQFTLEKEKCNFGKTSLRKHEDEEKTWGFVIRSRNIFTHGTYIATLLSLDV
jgi:hypothetical protein